MVTRAVATGLTTASRVLTALVSLGSGVLGLILFLAPGWAAPRFAWQVSAFVAMTIGAWFLGNCVWAARIARGWSWGHWASGLVYLWSFGVLQLVVLIVYAAKVRTSSPIAWLYLGLIGLMVVTALVGVLDLVRLRPRAEDPGPPVTWWMRALVLVFLVFVAYLVVVALLRPGAATGGRVFPQNLSPFTLRSFGVYFLSLVLGVLALAGRRTSGPFIGHVEGGLGITTPLLVATCVNLSVFDFARHPGQWIYLGSYVAVLVISIPIVVVHRRAQRRSTPAGQAAGDQPEIPGQRRAEPDERSRRLPGARLRRH